MFAERLKQLRKQYSITQEDLGKFLGLNGKSTISNYENGRSTPDINLLIKIARYFDVTVDYLIGNSDSKKGTNTLQNDHSFISKEVFEYFSSIKNVNAVVLNGDFFEDKQQKIIFLSDLMNIILGDHLIDDFLSALGLYLIYKNSELNKYLDKPVSKENKSFWLSNLELKYSLDSAKKNLSKALKTLAESSAGIDAKKLIYPVRIVSSEDGSDSFQYLDNNNTWVPIPDCEKMDDFSDINNILDTEFDLDFNL